MPFQDDLRRYGPDASYAMTLEQAPRLLRPADGVALRELQRRDLADAAAAPAGVPEHLRLLPLVRRPGRRGRRPRPRRASCSPGGAASSGRSTRGAPATPSWSPWPRPSSEFAIPIDPFEALISAFEQDQTVTEYDDLRRSCSTTARGRPTRWATWSCTWPAPSTPRTRGSPTRPAPGLQLANFWQDVARDLAIGRVYLPREDRERFGVRRRRPRRPGGSRPAFAALLKFEVERARALFAEGRALVPRMPRRPGGRRRPVLARRAGDPRPDRGAGVRRADARGPTLGKLAKLGLLGRGVLVARRRRRAAAGDGRRRGPVAAVERPP